MKLFQKYGLALLTSLLSISLFAINGGYENSLDASKGPYDGYAGYADYETSSVTPSASVTRGQFAQMKALKSVNLTGVTEIRDAAFAYSAIETLSIPSTVKTMGFIAFGGCTNLTSVSVGSNDSIDGSKSPFCGCDKLVNATMPGDVPAKWDFKSVFPNVTLVRCPSSYVKNWQKLGVGVYATEDSYVVQYMKNDGSGASSEHYIKRDVTTALKYCSSQLGWKRDGYEFLGWAQLPTSTSARYINGQKINNLVDAGKSLKLYAVWAPKASTYVIEFCKNDSSGVTFGCPYPSGVSSKLFYQSSQLGWTRSGYEFLGWAQTAGATSARYINGQQIKDLAAAGKTLKLYAVWALKSATFVIEFDKNDGSGVTFGCSFPSGVESKLFYQSSQLGWTRIGYEFLGWAQTKTVTSARYINGQKIKDLVPAGKVLKLYAVWALKSSTYVIEFIKNDGGNTTFGCAYPRDVTCKLFYQKSQLGWLRDGYDFMGWARTSGATVPEYLNGADICNLANAGATLKLYAVWKPVKSLMPVKAKSCSVKPASNVGGARYAGDWLPDGGSFEAIVIDDLAYLTVTDCNGAGSAMVGNCCVVSKNILAIEVSDGIYLLNVSNATLVKQN